MEVVVLPLAETGSMETADELLNVFGKSLADDGGLIDRRVSTDGQGQWPIVNIWRDQAVMDAGNACAQAAPEMSDFMANVDLNSMTYYAYEIVE